MTVNDYVCVDRTAYSHLLQECGAKRALSRAKQVHSYIVENGLIPSQDVLIGNLLIGVYDKCASPDDACWVFDRMPHKDVVSWNTMISAYAQHGQGKRVFTLFHQLQKVSLMPTVATFVSIISTFSSHTDLLKGKQAHASVVG
eukprot:c4051_g2_i1 orf=483-911(+)